MKRVVISSLCLSLSLLLLVGCAKEPPPPEAELGQNPSGAVTDPFVKETETLFDEQDFAEEYDEEGSVRITLTGTGATSSSDSVRIEKGRIILTEEATYLIEGVLDDGMIVVDAKKSAQLRLILRGASITSSTSAALYVKSAKKVIVTLADGSENLLRGGESFVAIDDNHIDGALFAKSDLTLNGTGSLRVESPAGHGIVAKDELSVTGGNYTVETLGHGIDVNDRLRIEGATLSLKTGKDGLHAENTDDKSLGSIYIGSGSFSVESTGDGISASATVELKEGSFSLLTGGGSANAQKEHTDFQGGMKPPGMRATSSSNEDTVSAKGIKAEGGILIEGGSYTVDSADDGLHSGTGVTVRGGAMTVKTGDDGIHADESLQIENGTIEITDSYEGLEAVNVLVAGGEIRMICRDDGINAAGGRDGSGGEPSFGGGPSKPGFGGSSSKGSVTVSGGTVYIRSSGDGIDANGTLSITGGAVTICGPVTGDTATLDFDVSGTIGGGTFIGTGSSFMAQTFSQASQGVISLNVGKREAGTKVTLTDKTGAVILTHTPELPFEVVILSSPDMTKGESYTISIGDLSDTVVAE